MKVYINNQPVIVFKGATLGDAVLASSKRRYRLLCSGYLVACDRFGNITEPDGPVQEGQHFRLGLSKH